MSGGATLDRRRLIGGATGFAALGLAGCATSRGPSAYSPPIAPIRASLNRLFDITVCLRPFRAAGPRLETEQVGSKLVVHNYGHGGSGWSLSWGSAHVALAKAMQASPQEIAVIGCGALGLTTATVALQAGVPVTIYARDLLPDARSARATGVFTPSSRIALDKNVSADFPAQWEEMARTTFRTFRSYMGLPGNPVEWIDRYTLSDLTPDEQRAHRPPDPLGFADFSDRIRDLLPNGDTLPPGSTPFPTSYVHRTPQLMFNLSDYGHTLMSDFFAAGGKFVHAEFGTLGDVTRLKEKVIINCTGYGARTLCRDESIVPVRGQVGRLIPQPEVNYAVFYNGVTTVPRSDGIVLQVLTGGDMRGYNDANETVDRAESEDAVKVLAELFAKFGAA
jgi:glycine/D-amino acid oxidase-like deaminating enzyme